MDWRHIVKNVFVALPIAASLTLTVDSTEGLAGAGMADDPNVRVYRDIEKHPNYRRSGGSRIHVARGRANNSHVATPSFRQDFIKPGTTGRLVSRNSFLAGPGARTPYPYWPLWRQTYIPTHCAPRWMC